VGCNGGATAQVVNSVTLSNKGTYLPTFPEAAGGHRPPRRRRPQRRVRFL